MDASNSKTVTPEQKPTFETTFLKHFDGELFLTVFMFFEISMHSSCAVLSQ